ncbi:hypothetical protein Tco_0869014, partial [Tanacetum coccineum]
RHKQALKTENPGKRIAFLENKHSKYFAKWLRKEVERELAISKESVSETVRWISYGPRATIVKYDAYNIIGYTFRTECHDGKVYQNSRVSVEAIDLHISKKVATTRQAFYYGVLQEIWVLDYHFRKIPLFKCDWVNHRAGGVKRKNLGTYLSFCFAANTLVKDFILSINSLLPVWFICLYTRLLNPGDAPACTLHLQLAYAHCICTLLLHIAFVNEARDPVMSSSSTVTYTSVYTDSEPGRVFWGADEELSDGGSPRVIVYGYDGLPMQPVAPPSPDYVPGPEHPPSPDYVPGPEHPPSPVEVPYVPEPELCGRLNLDEDPEEDPEEDHADYPADGGDDDDEPSDDDDDDTDDEDEEPFEDEDDDEEEEEHLALADSSVVRVVDHVPSAGDTEAFKTDESAPTPRSPQTKVPFAQTRLRRARKTVRLEPPMSPSMEARIAEYAAAPTPPSPPPSPLSPWSPPLPQIPSPPLPPPPSSLHLPPPIPTSLPLPSSPLPPLPALLFIPSPVDRREDILEAELPPHKRLCLTAPTSRYKVGESSTAAPRPTGGHRADYGFIGTTDAEVRRRRAEEVGYGFRDVWVDPTEAVEEVAPTTLEGVNARVTELAARVDGLVEDRQFHYKTARLLDQEALVSREAWAHSVGLSSAVYYELQAYRTHTQMQDYRIASQELLMMTLIAQVSSLQGQLSAALGQIQALQAKDQTHAYDREGAGSTTTKSPMKTG